MSSFLSNGTAQERTTVPRDTLIILQRFADAFNNGTDYKLTISSDGTVVFKRLANHFVDPSDPRARASEPIQARIPVEKVAELVAEFERIKYFSLKDRYAKTEDGCPGVGTDQGGADISITINGKTKTIAHYHGCSYEALGKAYPAELTSLEDKIDEVVGSYRWLK
jgi:hypothetical protein